MPSRDESPDRTPACVQKLIRRLHPHTRGRLAERLVQLIYLLHGYTPLPWPLQQTLQRHVQVDLLLRRGRTLVLVEVKYRENRHNLPFALHPAQQRRLQQALSQASIRAGQRWPGSFTAFRADVAFVSYRWPHVKSVRIF